jgi:hypothetical protein
VETSLRRTTTDDPMTPEEIAAVGLVPRRIDARPAKQHGLPQVLFTL